MEIQRLAGPREEGPYVVPVWGGKGGINKSTIAWNLAYMLGHVGPTLLVNADKRQTGGGVTALTEDCTKPLTDEDGAETVPFELTESDDPAELGSVRQLRQFLFVVTDNAPHRDVKKLRAAAKGDLTVVPFPPRKLDSKGILSSVAEHLQPYGANYRFVLSPVEYTQTSRAKGIKDSLRDIGQPVFTSWIRKYTCHEMLTGEPVYLNEDDPKAGNAASDMYLFGDEVLRHLGTSYKVPRLLDRDKPKPVEGATA